MDHVLSIKFPTRVVKTFKLADDGTVEESVTGEEHCPGHSTGDYVECCCGEEWEGIDAEEKSKKHLYRQEGTRVLKEQYAGITHRGWKLRYDKMSHSLYWTYTGDQDLSLKLYATPCSHQPTGISLQMHNNGGEHLLTKTIATDQGPEQVVENYVEIMTRYLDNNWMTKGENQG